MKYALAFVAAVTLMGVSTMTSGTNGGILLSPPEGGPHYIEIGCADFHRDDPYSQNCVTSDKTVHYRITPVGFKCAWDGHVLDCKLSEKTK